jgi:hypothetical protein
MNGLHGGFQFMDYPYMEVSINGGTPRAGWIISMENPSING